MIKEIVEGKTQLFVHAGLPTKRMEVFYNPKKEFDRTLSVKILKELKPKKCLDLLCASGARGIRLMKEAGISDMTFNDANPKAIKLLKKNLKKNGLKARVYNKDACELLYALHEYFDFIDIDPFGSPNPYLEASIRFLKRNGVLAITATDTAALMGVKSKACFRKYHSIAKRHPFMKESGLRILIKHVVETGAEFEYALKPVLAHCTAHYYRTYFIKDPGAKRADALLENIKCLHYCPKCGHRGYKACAHKESISIGPLYAGNINSLHVDDEFIKSLNAEDAYPPWHYTTTELARLFKLSNEPATNELLKKVKGVRAHYEPKGFKTKFDIARIKRIFKK